jgi:hypothetical protein
MRYLPLSLWLLAAILLLSYGCIKENLERLSFVEVETLEVLSKTEAETIIQGLVKGLEGSERVQEAGIILHEDSLALAGPVDPRNFPRRAGRQNLGNEAFQAVFQGLPPDTFFFYRAYALTNEGEVKLEPAGGIGKFIIPGIRAANILEIKRSGIVATAFGKVTPVEKIDDLEEYGHLWFKSGNDLAAISLGRSISENGEYESVFYNLEPGVEYRVVAFARETGKPGRAEAENVTDTVLLNNRGLWQDLNQELTATGATPSGSFQMLRRYGAVYFTMEREGQEVAFMGLGTRDGVNGLLDFWAYDPDEGKWTPVADEFPGGTRRDVVHFELNGMVYVGTGQDFNGTYKNDFYRFDGTTWDDTPIRLSNDPSDERTGARRAAYAFVLGGRAYVGGGLESKTSRYWRSETLKGHGGADSINCICECNRIDEISIQDLWEFDGETETWRKLSTSGGNEDITGPASLLNRFGGVAFSDKSSGAAFVLFGGRRFFSVRSSDNPVSKSECDGFEGSQSEVCTDCSWNDDNEVLGNGFRFERNGSNFEIREVEKEGLLLNGISGRLFATHFFSRDGKLYFGGGYTQLGNRGALGNPLEDMWRFRPGGAPQAIPECGLGAFAQGAGFAIDKKIYFGFDRGDEGQTRAEFWVHVPED